MDRNSYELLTPGYFSWCESMKLENEPLFTCSQQSLPLFVFFKWDVWTTLALIICVLRHQYGSRYL